jgi:hypothetical protein
MSGANGHEVDEGADVRFPRASDENRARNATDSSSVLNLDAGIALMSSTKTGIEQRKRPAPAVRRIVTTICSCEDHMQ